MSDDADHLLLTLPRGDRGEIRVSRSRYEGHTFTRLQLWYPGEAGALRPGRQCVTIRDHELGDVLRALGKVAQHVQRSGGPAPREATRRNCDNMQTHNAVARRTGDLTTSDRSSDMEAF